MKHLFTIAFLLLFQTLNAADYYVSPSGSDANDGSSAQPWQTLQYSVDQLQPGDVLHVQSGTYNEKIAIHVSGAASNRIRITGDANLPVIDGTGLTSQNALISIVDQSYITIENLELRNNTMNDAQGILVEGACTGIQLRLNNIHDIHFSANAADTATATTNAQPIIIFGSNPSSPITELDIWANTIYDCRLGYSEGIAVNGNVSDFQVHHNTLLDLTNIGIVAIGYEGTCSDSLVDQARNGFITDNRVYNCRSPYAACAGIYIDGAKDIIVERNSSHENNYGIEVGCEHPGKSAENIIVRNNILYYNDYEGLAVGGYDYDSLSGKVSAVKVYNNTFFKNDSLYDGNGELLISYVEGLDIQNNIFYTNDQEKAITLVDSSTNLNYDYNLYFTESGNQDELIDLLGTTYTLNDFQLLGNETSGQFADPLFDLWQSNNVDDNYFSMGFNSSSPAIDNGNPMLTETDFGYSDFYNFGRIWNYPVDIGASEFWAEGLEEYSKTLLTVWPNPATDCITIENASAYRTYQVNGMSGNCLLKGKLTGNTLSLDTLPAGLYVILLEGESTCGMGRFVKTIR